MSWLRQPAGYQVLFNRDELRTRKPAEAPRIHGVNGKRFISPIDGDFGGTWLGINEFGMTLGLLNRYVDNAGPAQSSESKPGRLFTSRGSLVQELLQCQSISEIENQLLRMRLERFQPFTLAIISAEGDIRLSIWSGRRLQIQTQSGSDIGFITSSSHDTRNVMKSREVQFRNLRTKYGVVDIEMLSELHRSHTPARGPNAICMHRNDAGTVSFSRIDFSHDISKFTYYPAALCQRAIPTAVQMRTISQIVTS